MRISINTNENHNSGIEAASLKVYDCDYLVSSNRAWFLVVWSAKFLWLVHAHPFHTSWNIVTIANGNAYSEAELLVELATLPMQGTTLTRNSSPALDLRFETIPTIGSASTLASPE